MTYIPSGIKGSTDGRASPMFGARGESEVLKVISIAWVGDGEGFEWMTIMVFMARQRAPERRVSIQS
ncbi:hypothetical protein DEJ37_17030 [Kocuria rosea]|nr:hypothetical protein DEJ37_17030 [Kocuria rosea]